MGILLAGIFYGLPFADLLTGFLLSSGLASEGGLSSPSQLARMLLLALLGLRLRPSEAGIVAAVLGLALVSETFGAFHHQSTYGVGIGLANGFKLAYIATLAFVLSGWISKGHLAIEELLSLALNSAFIYSTNVVLALFLGFGEKTYGAGTFGTKGFVPSNNGLSMTLGTLLVMAATTPTTPWTRIRNGVLLLGCLFIGAKASLVFVVVYVAILLARAKPQVKILSVGVVGLAAFLLRERIQRAFSLVFDVIIFRFQLNEGNFFRFIASGRDANISTALGNLGPDFASAARLVTGMGALVSFRDLRTLELLHPAPGGRLVYETLETDFFDLLFQYGVVAASVYLGVIAFVASRFAIAGKPIHLMCWMLVAGFSLVAGHVLFNGMSSTVVAVMIALSATSLPSESSRSSMYSPQARVA